MAENRNKLATVFADFFAHMKELVGQTGEESDLKIQKVVEGEAPIGMHPIPFVTIQFLKMRTKHRADRDIVWDCQMRIRISTRATSADGATVELLTKAALVTNKIQAYDKPDGVEGFEATEWALTFPIDPTTPATAQADSTQSFTVAVALGEN